MIPRNHRNTKAYIDLSCPGCGMKLDDRKTDGFVFENQTYCCKGCAQGNGCTCSAVRMVPKKAGQKPGHMGQRNPENSVKDRNYNQEVDTSGNVLGNRRETDKAPARFQSRVPYATETPKGLRSRTKPRDSTREQARGRSEFTKRMSKSTRVDRTSVTGTKNEKR